MALCLTALVGVGASGSGGNTAGVAGPKETFVYPMGEGDHVSDSSVLDGLLQLGYRDVFVIINTSPGAGDLSVVIEDCCITGDTMLALLIKPGVGVADYEWATSPDTITLVTPLPGQSWALVVTGYIDCPGAFPAGYYYGLDLRGPF